MAQFNSWIQELSLCLESPSQFKSLLPSTLSHLKEGGQAYQTIFLKNILHLISSKDIAPTERFYALYLLFKAIDYCDREFGVQIAKNQELLTYIYQAGQFDLAKKIAFDIRGKKFFFKKPTVEEARTGMSFVRLCVESLIHLEHVFKAKDSEDPCYSFCIYKDTLVKKLIEIPTYYQFIGKDYDLSVNLATWNYHKRPPKTIDTNRIKKSSQAKPEEKQGERIIEKKEETLAVTFKEMREQSPSSTQDRLKKYLLKLGEMDSSRPTTLSSVSKIPTLKTSRTIH